MSVEKAYDGTNAVCKFGETMNKKQDYNFSPFLSGLVSGVALTLAFVVVLMSFNKEGQLPFKAAAPGVAAAPAVPAAPAAAAGQNVFASRGPANAPVVIEEYADFYCGFCKKSLPTVLQIMKDYPTQVRFIFRNMPLAVTPGQGSYFVHEAGVCANEQGKFWEFFEEALVYSGRPDASGVGKIGAKIGLDAKKFESCMKSARPRDAIDADLRSAASRNITGTPTFFVNGEMMAGAYPYETFKSKIDGILSGKYVPVKPAAPQPAKQVEFNDLAGRPFEGPENAAVTLVEFSDFHCPFCRKIDGTLKQVRQNYPDKVKIVWRHFPLAMHKGADRTHQASECAHAQGRFWQFEEKIFSTFGNARDEAFYNSTAEQIGLKMKDFKACMENTAAMDTVKKDMAKGSESGVTGTPAVFINGRIMKGAQPYESFKKAIDEELQKAAEPSKK